MKNNHWVEFVNNFIYSLNRVVPFHSFFCYEVNRIDPNNNESYYAKNLTKKSIENYLHQICHCDPIFFKSETFNNFEIMRLHDQKIPDEYSCFLSENNIVDNIELLFKHDYFPSVGISLIRYKYEGMFSDLEISIIESCYSLAKFNIGYNYNEKLYQKQVIPSPISEILTKKEKTVLQHILNGKRNQDIADELFVGITTVKTHIQHILRKTMVNSKQELICKILSA